MSNSSRFVVATHVLTNLAVRSDERLSSDRLAWSVNTNPVVIRQLLCSLREANLVDSKRGPTGGFTLARDPEEITLRNIYEAVEDGEPFCFHTNEPNDECTVGEYIQPVLGELLEPAIQAMLDELDSVTIADVHETIFDTADTEALEV
ncbi:Rrf2 family transcriptional regulator (plasmid) [Haloferax mediterranei ATCC 33500]|uniref:AsnC family transcriptional regulator n=1 Tax=Haloferax mediterranei (strain ATCC 33500 / DSM 1411 / JCM 8866 / NBRC 14739 / NCIMB 2177 / R-4) TaxID=523841 RepID=I3RB23_HALMT|nr:Rrf2 family transcriptional regulator [Haloferax mediterranei]AFK21433.1 transcriptional regulator, BadM/Rrf2 family [Haloferax mediterranei ATCC 33500]AHZ24498.1 AsnC family transcriptional regulator [Haloferax mediterranei ATCC 33500]ELZ97250.1 AsnC family transcriptional regulator [Haloferax mediterranei ATCC 33500]MDX5990014.1 Rrf2 family transcriptional regulator [Haloferax mediterranei ATCC 33500]QCQ76896.1 Rrf2 family transcriptional regulator [Haloferax mediterranei ATCC 33500]